MTRKGTFSRYMRKAQRFGADTAKAQENVYDKIAVDGQSCEQDMTVIRNSAAATGRLCWVSTSPRRRREYYGGSHEEAPRATSAPTT